MQSILTSHEKTLVDDVSVDHSVVRLIALQWLHHPDLHLHHHYLFLGNLGDLFFHMVLRTIIFFISVPRLSLDGIKKGGCQFTYWYLPIISFISPEENS